MKKKILFLLIPMAAILSSCVMYNGQGKPGASKKSSNPEPEISSIEKPSTEPAASNHFIPTSTPDVNEGTAVKIYLVFGEYGQYKGELVTNRVPAPFYLEHAMEIDARAGEDLPGADDVTSIVEGSTFVAWTAYNDDGKLTSYTKVPNIDQKILYASFSGGKGGNTGYDPIPPAPGPTEYAASSTGALPTSGFGFKFTDDSYMAAVHTEDYDGFQQYLISQRAFKKDQVFTLYDFGSNAGWVVTVDPYSFGGTSAHSENWKEYISNDGSKYTVLKDFNVESVYIKIKNEADQVYFQLAA